MRSLDRNREMYFELFRRRDVSVDLERRRIVVKRRLRHEAIDYAGFEDEAIRRAAVLEVADFVAFLNPLPRQCLDHTRGNLRHADEYTADLTDRGILAVDDDHRTGDNRGGVTLRIVQPARVDALRFFRDATGDQCWRRCCRRNRPCDHRPALVQRGADRTRQRDHVDQ